MQAAARQASLTKHRRTRVEATHALPLWEWHRAREGIIPALNREAVDTQAPFTCHEGLTSCLRMD